MMMKMDFIIHTSHFSNKGITHTHSHTHKKMNEKSTCLYLKFVQILLNQIVELLQTVLQGINQVIVASVEVVQIASHVFGRCRLTFHSSDGAVPARLELFQSRAVALQTEIVDLRGSRVVAMSPPHRRRSSQPRQEEEVGQFFKGRGNFFFRSIFFCGGKSQDIIFFLCVCVP